MELRHKRNTTLNEREAQQIIRSLTSSLNGIYSKGIIHRDLNVNNVLLHFPSLEPKEHELQDVKLVERMEMRRKKLVSSDLLQEEFSVKIADYGLSCRLGKQSLAETPCGTLEVIAPDALQPGFDHRVDVWGVGVIFYMLLTLSNVFSSPEELEYGTWSISTELNYSIEALRFLNEILQWSRDFRPFPD